MYAPNFTVIHPIAEVSTNVSFMMALTQMSGEQSRWDSCSWNSLQSKVEDRPTLPSLGPHAEPQQPSLFESAPTAHTH